MKPDARSASHVRAWLVAPGLGLLAGYLVGAGMMEGHTHAAWPALAGSALGLAASLAAPVRPLRVASFAGGVAVTTAVAKIVAVQLARGRWPITDEVTIAQYGTATQATLRAAVMLGVFLGVPCLLAALLVAAARRSDTRRPGPVEGHALAPRGTIARRAMDRRPRGAPDGEGAL